MVQSLKLLLKNHYGALLACTVVGFVMVLPQLELAYSLRDRYQGIGIIEIDNDDYYYSRIKDAYDGKLTVDNPRIYNPENSLAMIPSLPEVVVATVAKIFTVSVGEMVLLGNFLFPLVLYLLLYFVFWQVTEKKLLALLVPAVIILASNIAFFPREIVSLLTDPSALTPSAYSRPINPQISSIIFFIFIATFYSFLKYRLPVLIVLSGLTFGLLFYSYLYSWTIAGVLLGLQLGVVLWQRDYRLARDLAVIITLGLATSALYWINVLNIASLPIYEAMKKRFGFYQSHSPFFSTYLALDIVLLLLMRFFYKNISRRNFYFVGALVVACAIAINQQVVSGIRFFPGHYHWYYVVPISTFVAIWFFYLLIEKWQKKYTLGIFTTLLALLVVSNGVLSQHHYYLREKDRYTDLQRYDAVYDWINSNLAADSVVLTQSTLSDKLTVYTSVYSYLPHRTDRQYIIPQEYFRHTYFTKLYLDGQRDPTTAVQIDDYTLMYTLFGYYNLYRNDCYACFTPEEMEQLRLDYEQFLAQDFQSNLKKYKIDYALLDTQSVSDWNLDEFGFMQLITEINGVRIYKVS